MRFLLPLSALDWWSGLALGYFGMLLQFALAYRRGRRFGR